MNRGIVCGLAVMGTVVTLTAAERPKMTREQIERRKLEYFGGHLLQPVETKVIAVIDETGKVDAAVIAGLASSIDMSLGYTVNVGVSDKAGVRIRLIERGDLGMLCVMPDDGEVLVNIERLNADKPERQVLNRRIMKEVWRGLVYVLGGGNTYLSSCVMKPVASLSDLDGINAIMASPDVIPRIKEGAANLGLKTYRRVTYRQACQEGWAPAPTNDIQQAIWDKVHAAPKNPMKIEFDPKKGK